MKIENSVPTEVVEPSDGTILIQPGSQSHNITPSYGIESVQSKPQAGHRHTKRLVLVVILLSAVTALIIIVGLLLSRNNKPGITPPEPSVPSKPAVISITAKSKDDLANVCTGNVISNAPSMTEVPRVIAVFEETTKGTSEYATADYYITDKSWVSENRLFNKINLVGCMTHKSESFTGKSCQVTNDMGKTAEMKLYTTEYQLKIYQAQSGKVLGGYTIKSPDTSCPEDVYYSENDSRVFTVPDTLKLNQSIRPYISSN